MKQRYNIRIDAALHQWAVAHADSSGRDFSGYLEDLIRSDRGDVALTGPEIEALPPEVRDAVKSFSQRQRAAKQGRTPKAPK